MVTLILAILVGLGFIIGITTYASSTAVGTNMVLQSVGQSIYSATYMFFTWLVLMTPLIAVFVPLYFVYNRERIDGKTLLFSGIYGILVLYILVTTGLYNYIVNFFVVNYHASFITLLVGIKEIVLAVWSYMVGFVGFLIDNTIGRLKEEKKEEKQQEEKKHGKERKKKRAK